MLSSLLALSAAAATLVSAGAVVDPNNLPYKSEKGQYGWNNCSTVDDPKSLCQTAWMNGIDDFCLWGPPTVGAVGDMEQKVVAYCSKNGHGARLIPKGTVTGIQWLSTKYFWQITGVGDFTKINIKKGDAGGELDPHGPNGLGNPIGGVVLGVNKGKKFQFLEWHSFIGATIFSFRACLPNTGDGIPTGYCPHIYDVMGAQWNDPAKYQKGLVQSCLADVGLKPGVYGTSTFHQGDARTPPAHPAPSSRSCKTTTLAVPTYPAKVQKGPKRVKHIGHGDHDAHHAHGEEM